MRIDHRRAHIPMAKQLLDRPDVACLWQTSGRQASPRGRKVTDDLLRQIRETVKRFSWLFVAKQQSGLAFRGKAWRHPAIHHRRAAEVGENGEIASLRYSET